MRAGPYIQRRILFELDSAFRLRCEAAKARSHHLACLKAADAADRRAADLANDTDFKVPHREPHVSTPPIPGDKS